MKIAFTGAGYINNIHAKAARKIKDVELAAVVGRQTEKTAVLMERFGIKNQYLTVDQLLKAGKVDALVVGTPNFLHAPQTIAALKAGVHVMVEKPMAMNAREAEKMLEASAQSGAILMVAHNWRFDEEINWLKAQSKKMGRIIRTKGYSVHANWGPSGWFTEKKLAGGGAMADMGVHAIDTVRYLLGDPQPVSVHAKIGTYYGDYDVDDTGVILVEWDNGVLSYMESGWWQPHVDGPESSTQLYGEKGFGQVFPTLLKIPNPKTQKVDIIQSGYQFPRKEHGAQVMYDAQMAYFIKCIRGRKTPVPGGLEGWTNMKIVDAAYKSARTGRLIKISK
jgi:predicted dehydrogenase